MNVSADECCIFENNLNNHIMRNIVIFVLMLTLHQIQAQKIKSAGVYLGEGVNRGKAFVFGSQETVNAILDVAKNYSLNNADALIKNYSTDFGTKILEDNRRWLNSMEKISMAPYRIIPVKIEGTDETLVLTWSVEDRNWKDGSYQKQNLMEIFTFNAANKIIDFSQWSRNYPDSQFGLTYGGKYYGKQDSEVTGRPLVFSNRGEVEALEAFIAAYNKMDGRACSEVFADTVTINGMDGNKYILTKESWLTLFDSYQSVEWKPYSIAPMKIANTDPISGATMVSRERRNFKDGSVWEKELVEMFYFDLEGKIYNVVQYARELN